MLMYFVTWWPCYIQLHCSNTSLLSSNNGYLLFIVWLAGVFFNLFFIFCSQCPEAVISLYNSAIEHLATVASSESLSHVSWPITEFRSSDNKGAVSTVISIAYYHEIKYQCHCLSDLPKYEWNSDANLSSLSSVILSLCLPLPPPGAEDGKDIAMMNLEKNCYKPYILIGYMTGNRRACITVTHITCAHAHALSNSLFVKNGV